MEFAHDVRAGVTHASQTPESGVRSDAVSTGPVKALVGLAVRSSIADVCNPVRQPPLLRNRIEALRRVGARYVDHGAASDARFDPRERRTTVVRRYVERRLAGLDPTARSMRAASNEAGFMSSANHGWILIGTASQNLPKYTCSSKYGEKHTEELLIEWAVAQGAKLSVAPSDDSNPALRVKEIYTERHPCGRDDAEQARRQRTATDGCCHDYLTRILHKDVVVSFSSDSSPAAHEALRAQARADFILGREVRTFMQAYNTRRDAVGYHPALGELVRTWVKQLKDIQFRMGFNGIENYKESLTQTRKAGVDAINAWTAPAQMEDDRDNVHVGPDRRDDDEGGNGDSRKRPGAPRSEDLASVKKQELVNA